MGTGILSNVINSTNPDESGVTTFGGLFGLGLNVAAGIVISVSVIAIILSGYKFILARGDPKAAATAKLSLTYSIVALLLTLMAVTVFFAIKSTIGLTGVNSAPTF